MIVALTANFTSSEFRIPDTVRTLGGNAFYKLSSLKTVIMPSITNYKGSVFDHCPKLETIKYLGTALPVANNQAFAGISECPSLKTVYVPAEYTGEFGNKKSFMGVSLTIVKILAKAANDEWVIYSNGSFIININGWIGDYQKGQTPWYSQREAVTHVYISKQTTDVGDYTFYNFTNLQRFEIEDGNTQFKIVEDMLFGKGNNWIYGYAIASNRTEINLDNLSGKGTKIEPGVFAYAKNLKKFKTTDRLELIGDFCFENSALEEIIIVRPVLSSSNYFNIGSGAFSGCASLKNVTYEDSKVPNCNSNVFDNTNANLVISVNYQYPLSSKLCGKDVTGNEYKCGTACTFSFDQSSSTLTITGSKLTDGTRLELFRENAVKIQIEGITEITGKICNFLKVETITINSQLTTLGENAFFNYNKAVTVNYQGTSVPECPTNAFNSVTVSSIKVGPNYPFGKGFCGKEVTGNQKSCGTNCTISLTNGMAILKGTGVASLREMTEFTKNITKLLFRDGITEIQNDKLNELTELLEIEIPTTMSSIPWDQFNQSTKVTAVRVYLDESIVLLLF